MQKYVFFLTSNTTILLTYKFQVRFSKNSDDIPKNELKGVISADAQQENGVIYDKKPFKIALEAGKI